MVETVHTVPMQPVWVSRRAYSKGKVDSVVPQCVLQRTIMQSESNEFTFI